MKLKFDAWHHLLDVYAKFQIDILKHVKKNPRKLRKIQNTQKNCQNSKNMIFAKNKIMSSSIQWATYLSNLKDLSGFMRPWLQKMDLTYFWL